jgi:HD-GYP domain-containing protein (c-di-GMP phosphodiesterase class II)
MAISNEAAKKSLVYIVDGNRRHRNDLIQALTPFYAVSSFDDAKEALEELTRQPPVIVVVDENSPPIGGDEMLRRIRLTKKLRETPIVCTSTNPASTFLNEAGSASISIPLTKPYKRSALLSAISSMVNRSVEDQWEEIEPVQKAALKETVQMFNTISDCIDRGEPVSIDMVMDSCQPLVEAVKNNRFKDILKGIQGHDNYTYVHSMRVATFLSLFGNAIGIKGEQLLMLTSSGLVHDIGKISIPHEILNNPGKLTDDEFAIMKGHVDNSVEVLLRDQNIPKGVLVVAAQHHEKLDGTGYPKGIKGKEVNELARMASIVDIFGALTDRRVYKDSLPPEKALDILVDMNRALDQDLLSLFREMLLDWTSDSTHH